jgi:RNA polymerase sigma-70 factor (ECF subfamily)
VDDADAPLVERARLGDRQAQGELYRRYRAPLCTLVRRYAGADTEDVVQRAFVQAFERIESFRGDGPFRAWLFRIAVHTAVSHARGSKRPEPIDIDDLAAFTNGLGTSRLVAAEVWQKVAGKLALLPPKQRLCVELRLFHDLSFREVAEIVGCSEEAAKVNFHYGVKRLRDVIPP